MQEAHARAASPRDATLRRSWPSTVIPIAVVLATLAVLGWSAWPIVRPTRTVQVAQVVFSVPDESEPQAESESAATPSTRMVQAPGWVEAEPYYTAVTTLADGIVETIDVLEGEPVRAGQLVATLVDDEARLDLASSAAALAAAEADRAVALADLRAAQEAWDQPVAREKAVAVARAELAQRRAELARLPTLIESAEATLVRLEEEAKRARSARQRGATVELELVVAEQRVAAQRAEVAALRASEPVLGAGVERLQAELRAAERDFELRIDERRALDAATAILARAEAHVVRRRAERDDARLALDRMVIRSPMDGVVLRRLKAPGDKAIRGMDDAHSAHLVHVYDPAKLQVRVDVPLADASQVHPGQACEIVVDVLPGTVFHGSVLRVTHEADLQKNTLQVKVRVLEPSPLLRPEMLARVKFLPSGEDAGGNPSDPSAAVLIPESSMQDGRVWLVADRRGSRGRLQPVAVQTHSREDGWILVSGPLRAGDLLAHPEQGYRPGQSVRIGKGGDQ
ncbi:MAG: efflux RND transporter periplasmic adaptor subunit [Planctomycetota bacterium]